MRALQKLTEAVCEALNEYPSCWDGSIVLREAIQAAGLEARVVFCTVRWDGKYKERECDQHFIVLSGDYLCDPTSFQFGLHLKLYPNNDGIDVRRWLVTPVKDGCTDDNCTFGLR